MVVPISFVQGDTVKLDLPVLDANGDVLDLQPIIDIVFAIKRSRQDSDAAAVFEAKLSDEDDLVSLDPDFSDNNVVLVVVPPAATAALRTGRLYFWGLRIKDSEDNLFTPCEGTILVMNRIIGN